MEISETKKGGKGMPSVKKILLTITLSVLAVAYVYLSIPSTKETPEAPQQDVTSSERNKISGYVNDQTSENYPAVGNQKHDYKETEKKVIWLGDSRTRRIAEYLDTDIMFLYKSGAKCKILKEKWIPKIENILNKDPDKIV